MSGFLLLLRVLLSLACVIGLVWWVGKRWGHGGTQRSTREPSVQVVGRQSVGRHSGVAVVAVGSRRLLLGYGEQQVTLLTELAPVAEVQPAPAPPKAPRTPDKATHVDLPDSAVRAVRATPLQGSILSPETWKQAVRALQDRTVRR